MKAKSKRAVRTKKARIKAPAVAPKYSGQEDRERGHRYAKIIARAWADEAFLRQLVSTPEKVFAEYSLKVPKGTTIEVVSEPTETKKRGVLTFVLPPKPADWAEIESKSLTVSSQDDWLDSGATMAKPPKPKPKPTFPCSKCWNGCC